MDLIVLIMIVSIYIGAVAAPVALYVLARRTGHGAGWQSAIVLCGAVIWIALTLGFLREMMDVEALRGVTEPAGFLALIAFAILAVIGLALALKSWPGVTEEDSRSDTTGPRIGLFAADFE